MKLLFDANLSSSLARSLSDLFPDSAHVEDFGDLTAEDPDIWNYALEHSFTIVTKAADFDEMSQLAKQAPKIVCIRRGNCSTVIIEHIVRSNADSIFALGDSKNELSVLILL